MPGLASRADYVPVERYDQIRALVTRTRAEGGQLFIAPDQQTSYMVLRRTTESAVEEHSRWDDILIVRAGTGSVELGARTTGARVAAPGELRGGRITTPRRLLLRPGDVARIPAGVPHAFVPRGPEPWEMLVVKVRRPDKPLKRTPDAKR
jgi:mannose-6-phosphate isomerase-like protein (cupin superfamily)